MTFKDDSSTLSSVQNTLVILKSFTPEEPILKVTDIAKKTGLSKSSISRYLTTLSKEGFVVKDSNSSGYALSVNILSLAGIKLKSMELHQAITPFLSKLVDQTGETAHIAILDNLDTIYIHKEVSRHPIEMKTYLGKKNPAYATSSGKVILAYSAPSLTEKVIQKGLIAYTSRTISNPIQLKEELLHIKNTGFCYSSEEYTQNVCSIAAPVIDDTNHVVAAITIVGPKPRFTKRNVQNWIHQVITTAQEASVSLGYKK